MYNSAISPSKSRANTLGNQAEIFLHSKENIEKFLNNSQEKLIERRHSFDFLDQTANFDHFFEDNRRSFLKEIEIFSEKSEIDTTNEENNRILTSNTENIDIDGKNMLFSSKSLANIPKTESSQVNSSEKTNNSQEKFLMKEKFIEIDLKYLNEVIFRQIFEKKLDFIEKI